MKNALTKIAALALLALPPVSAAQTGNFDLGVSFTYADWTIEEGRPDLRGFMPENDLQRKVANALPHVRGEGEDKATALGLVGRYTDSFKDSKAFWGAHLALHYKDADFVEWSGDLLGSLGWDAGRFAPYFAAGVSVAKVGIDRTVQGSASAGAFASLTEQERALLAGSSATFEDHNTAIGWKLALGVDYEASEEMTLFLQAEYADYGEEEITGRVNPPPGKEPLLPPITLKGEFTNVALHGGILWRF